MLIGDLPYNNNPTTDDIIVFSKDGQHLLKIKYSDFVRAIHSERAIITGTTLPDDNVGVNGDLYCVKETSRKYKYIKLEITAIKGNNNFTQITEFQFVNSSNVPYIWTGTNAWTNQKHHTTTDDVQAMLDGWITNTSKALWECKPTAANPIIVVLECLEPIDLDIYSKVQFITGGDAEARDPASWTISISNNNVEWTVVNTETSYSMTSDRLAVGYEKALTIPETTRIIATYLKESGHWIPILN